MALSDYQKGPYGILDIIERLDTINDSYSPTDWDTAFGWGDHSEAGYASSSITISAGDGLSGGGDLSSNRALSVDSSVARYGTSSSQVRTNSQLDNRFVKGSGDSMSGDLDLGDNRLGVRNIRVGSGVSMYFQDSSGNRQMRMRGSEGFAVYNRLVVGNGTPTNAPSNGLRVYGDTRLNNHLQVEGRTTLNTSDDGTNDLQVGGDASFRGKSGFGNDDPTHEVDVEGDVRVREENAVRFGGNSSSDSKFSIKYNENTESLDFNFIR